MLSDVMQLIIGRTTGRADRGRTATTRQAVADGQRTGDDDRSDDGTDDVTDGRTDRGRRTAMLATTATTGHDRTDAQRTDDDDGTDDGTDGQRLTTATMGRARRDGRMMYIVPKFQIRQWDQNYNVKANR